MRKNSFASFFIIILIIDMNRLVSSFPYTSELSDDYFLAKNLELILLNDADEYHNSRLFRVRKSVRPTKISEPQSQIVRRLKVKLMEPLKNMHSISSRLR
jgi:hypothetical protein